MSMVVHIHRLNQSGKLIAKMEFDGWSEDFEYLFNANEIVDLGDPYEVAVVISEDQFEHLVSDIPALPHIQQKLCELRKATGLYVISASLFH